MGRGYRRTLNRINEEFKSIAEVARIVSLPKAIDTFIGKVGIQIMVHNGHVEKEWIKKRLLKKHAAMNEYFERVFRTFPEEYVPDFQPKALVENCDSCVWVCWWQGLDNAPEIVKRCVKSIQAYAGNHKVVIITQENYTDFVTFPDWIGEKYRKGIITKTHLSDLLRISLLAQYGGVWLDSTFYCTGDLEPCFSAPIWSIKRPDYRHVSVACGEFANYSFGCTSEYRKVFAVLCEYLLEYWKNYDYMIDYLFLDYLIVLARRQNTNVDDVFAKISPNNKNCDELLKKLGVTYNSEEWIRLKEDTTLFKLTWKANFPKEVDGKQTFYGKLLNGELL